MTEKVVFNTLLVPIDFSRTSEAAAKQALDLASGEAAAVILLHVVDGNLADFAATHELGTRDEVVQSMRRRATERLVQLADRYSGDVEVDTIVSEGVPFLEIIRKAKDFAVDAIVMGKVGTRGQVEKLLFGSTAEKVLRGSGRPVLVLPLDE